MDKQGKFEKMAENVAKSFGTALSIAAHSLFFVIIVSLGLLGVKWNTVLLLLTTILSVEAIYLALFNQLITNKVVEEKEK